MGLLKKEGHNTPFKVDGKGNLSLICKEIEP